MEIKPIVNGVPAPGDVEPRLLLVHYLRENLGLTGTHIGCDTGDCGACTVLLEGLSGADGGLHPIQAAFKQEHGLQCGFCTPGMMLCASALLAADSDPDEETIRWELSGNLCRCTGYMNIVKAVRAAAGQVRAADGQAGAS